MGTDKTIIGVLGGIAIGAVLGVVFAPDKGSSTRTKIIKKGSGITDDLREKLDNITNSLSEKYNSFKSQGEDFAINGKGKVRA